MMTTDHEPSGLEDVIERIDRITGSEDMITFGQILEQVGRRSFGILLLVAGLITLAPVIGDIPGVPTVMALFVLLIAGQLLFYRHQMWLPQWMLNRSLAQNKVSKVLERMRRPSRLVDRLLRERFDVMVQDGGIYVIAAACICIAVLMPVMEMVPFSANLAGAALTAFGLSLTAHDGLLALIAHFITAAILVAALCVVL